MPFSPITYEEKPYNRCVDCIYIGKKCDGPNFLAMTTHRMCEWARLRKEYLHSQNNKWTNAYIAEMAGISKTTVDRFFAGDLDDTRVSTAAQILKILVNGTWGQYPCSLAAENSDVDNIKAECNYLREMWAGEQRKVEYLKEQNKFSAEQLISKDKILEERSHFLRLKDQTIRILSVFLGLSLCTTFGFLMIDFFNQDIGFFWVRHGTSFPALLGIMGIIVSAVCIVIILIAMIKHKLKKKSAGI